MIHKFLTPLKLQLFAEPGEAESVETQETANLETQTTVETQGTEGAQETSVETKTVTAEQSTEQPKLPIRDFEKDSAYAKMRREIEQTKKQSELLAKTMQQFGFKGTPEEIADQANAHYLQKPIEEVRQQRLQTEKLQQEETKRQTELDFYKNKEIERLMADDLQRIKKLDPTVKSLDDLGEDYFNLIQAGVDAEIAFSVYQQKKQRETKIPPAEIGKVNATNSTEKDYYSPGEVDKMSAKELDNPKIWEKVRQSMTKWK